jgi:hypothetical protein
MGNGGGVIVGVGGGVSMGCASIGCVPTCADAITNGGTPCTPNTLANSALTNLIGCAQTHCAPACVSFLEGCPLSAAPGCEGCLNEGICNMSLGFCDMN